MAHRTVKNVAKIVVSRKWQGYICAMSATHGQLRVGWASVRDKTTHKHKHSTDFSRSHLSTNAINESPRVR